MDETEIFRRLGMALAIGLLFGLERGWHARDEAEGSRVAGVRTFAIVGLLGGGSGWLAMVSGPVILAAAFLALSILLSVSYWASLKRASDVGLTTEAALLLTFMLGAACVLGAMAPAAAVAVVATLLLSLKSRLHGWVAHIRRLELDAALTLALLSVVILPVLPNQGFGPGGTLNPYALWLAAVVVAALSFFGYVAMRIGGADLGILLTGLFGGLASSTSTTLALSRRVRSDPSLAQPAAVGVVVAGSVTFVRIIALVAIFQPALLPALAYPMGAMAGTGFAGALLMHLLLPKGPAPRDEIGGISNPLELTTAFLFAAVLAAILVTLHYLKLWLGTGGVYVTAAISGITDVDALTISVARLVGDDLTTTSAAIAIFIAVSVNTVVKSAMSLAIGGNVLGMRVISAYAAVLVVGGIVLWVAR
ncbi:MgtC/SapB family protein [Acuticoccus kandeliae]|uniref:MgtC/SapB family protein n=1 Tax=Acuticoccus kandeliae TaxID=2073160 RepID=UPI0014749037|nr:MgtC/SapB family protein [Acuticoccus kandeliae]